MEITTKSLFFRWTTTTTTTTTTTKRERKRERDRERDREREKESIVSSKNNFLIWNWTIIYSYWLGSRTTAVLFDPRTDPFEGQTKLLLSEEPVYNCFVIHLHLKKNYSLFPLTYISIRCFKYPRPSSPRVGATFWHCDVNIMWLRKPIKKGHRSTVR